MFGGQFAIAVLLIRCCKIGCTPTVNMRCHIVVMAASNCCTFGHLTFCLGGVFVTSVLNVCAGARLCSTCALVLTAGHQCWQHNLLLCSSKSLVCEPAPQTLL
jgi:hypothetical protein